MIADPLLTPNTDRFVVFPVKYQDLWDRYKAALASFWTVEEVDFDKDLKDWEKLTEDERRYLTHVLAFFAASDGIVNENLAVNMYSKVQIPEARQFYAIQIQQEAVHSEAYSLMIDTYLSDHEAATALDALNTYPSIRAKAEWAMQYLHPSESFATQLVAFCAVEAIMFCSSFAAINWLRQRGMMPGLSLMNEFISREESSHADFAVTLYKHLQPENRLQEFAVRDILIGAAEYEMAFVEDALPDDLRGMNKHMMKEYVKYVTDFWLAEFGLDAEYHVENPFPWMLLNDLDGKTNFFENHVSEYNKAGVVGGKKEFAFGNDDF